MLLLFFNWYAHQVASLTKHADSAAEIRARRINSFAKPKPIAKASSTPPPDDGRIRAPATKQIEDLAVGVSAARIGPIQFKDNRYLSGEYLTLTLRITNLGRRPFDYKSWSQRKIGVMLRDQNRNYYNRIMIEDPPIVEQSILPGQTIVDVIAFEPPLKLFGYLELDLPSHIYISYLFNIPGMLIERGESPKPPQIRENTPPPPTPPVPPTQVYYDPEADPQIRSRVIADYRNDAKVIERKVNGMGFDHGRKFKLLSYDKLIDELAAKYNLTADQIRRIVNR
jgi:hypothetical protein